MKYVNTKVVLCHNGTEVIVNTKSTVKVIIDDAEFTVKPKVSNRPSGFWMKKYAFVDEPREETVKLPHYAFVDEEPKLSTPYLSIDETPYLFIDEPRIISVLQPPYNEKKPLYDEDELPPPYTRPLSNLPSYTPRMKMKGKTLKRFRKRFFLPNYLDVIDAKGEWNNEVHGPMLYGPEGRDEWDPWLDGELVNYPRSRRRHHLTKYYDPTCYWGERDSVLRLNNNIYDIDYDRHWD